MQPHKDTKSISELKHIAHNSEKLTSSLTDVMEAFEMKKHLAIFDFLKSKGLAISSLLSILLISPFYAVASVYALYKSKIKGFEIQGKKDAFYDAKNNENIDWRKLLTLHVKRFIYLINNNINLKTNTITAFIFDDTLLEKTGKKIEKLSLVYDHVSGLYIFGYKLLVCGFWDGASFIPLDFSLHREKGTKQEVLIKAHKTAIKKLEKSIQIVDKKKITLHKKEQTANKTGQTFAQKQNKTNQKRLTIAQESLKQAQNDLKECQKEQETSKKALQEARSKLKRYYTKERLFGLTNKERKEQYKKAVSAQSFGYQRRKETNNTKIHSMLQMLLRVVKNGFKANYVLCDSWFFCYELLANLQNLKGEELKLVSMVKINNQIFTVCEKNKKVNINRMPELYQKQTKICRKHKAKYIKIQCFYEDIRVNLFFVRMGRASRWHLLVTTDLDMSFIKLMEVYQIRWSIEVFFKESKQYLNLGGCKSSNFDAQIADTTISMLQHIMLSYYKRINYQQSFGNLFTEINQEIVELDLVSRIMELLWEIAELMCEASGFDFILFQEDIMRNEQIQLKFAKLIPEKVVNLAA